MKRLLILSFSPLATDARLLKQIELFRDDYVVTTCGYGPFPCAGVRHLELPDGARFDARNPKLVLLRLHRLLNRSLPAVRAARSALRGERFDVILANDADAVPLALALRPNGGVHVDLHEYWPRLHDEFPTWRRHIAPYYRWLCRRVRRADSSTTVSSGLAREYLHEFGYLPEVVTNASPYAERAMRPASFPMRLVHSGAGLRNRALHVMIEAAARVPHVTLDLYLTPNDPAYMAELRKMAEEAGDRVNLHDPVAYAQLGETLAQYDLGVSVIPPVNFSYLWSLPNKLFDYVQARLGVIVGPSPEMQQLVEETGVGVATDGFTADALERTLRGLTPERVNGWKRAATDHARPLSGEVQAETWQRAIDRLAEKAHR